MYKEMMECADMAVASHGRNSVLGQRKNDVFRYLSTYSLAYTLKCTVQDNGT